MSKIKILSDVNDGKTGKSLFIGDVVDLGAERNESAVSKGLAEWFETEKKEEKPKAKATVKGKKVESK